MTNQDDAQNQEVRNEEQERYAELIESISTDILAALKTGNINVDVAGLMQAIEAYAKFPNHYKPAVERWKARLSEITDILEAQYTKVQQEIKNLTDNNPKLSAYNKTLDSTE